MDTRKLTTILMAAILLFVLTACGGGTSNPGPVYPAAVTELTEDDLLAAGIPALPDDNGISSVSSARRASFGLEGWSEGVVDKHETINVHNLTTTTSGFVTDVPDETTSRVIGWAMYKLPGTPGDHTRSITLTELLIAPGIKVFAAVSNFSAGRWEPLGRIAVDPQDPTGSTYLLSPGPRYNRANGDSFLLLLIAHPGHGDMSGYKIELQDVLVSSIMASAAAAGFDEGMAGAIRWDEGRLDLIGPDIHDNYRLSQQFLPPVPAQPMVLFPQPLNLHSADGHDWFAFQNVTGAWDGDYGFDGIGFYDPDEVNGARHAYRLGVWDDTDIVHAVGVVPVTKQGGDNVLIGLLIPAPAVQTQVSISIDPATDTPERLATVNARGEFALSNIDGLEPGTYTFAVSGQGSGDPVPTECVAQLMEEEGIFYFIMSKPPIT